MQTTPASDDCAGTPGLAVDALASHSRFYQRLHRRYAAELALLPPGAPVLATMEQAYEALRARGCDAGTALRVGVNAGPCFAVTINGVLDYFGMNVNTAERLQSASGAGEVGLPAELVEAVRPSGALDGTREVAREMVELKGLPRPLAVVRIAPV